MECPQGHRKAALVCKATTCDTNIYFRLLQPLPWAVPIAGQNASYRQPFPVHYLCHGLSPSFLMGEANTFILISLLLSWRLQEQDICEQFCFLSHSRVAVPGQSREEP